MFLSDQGAPAIPTRMIAGLHYLKHLYDLSDEQVVERWVENPYWQYFTGEHFFLHILPIHPTSMTK
ncbi:transposase [Isorropodon fossajaponicum symbiont]|uniref:transposase n=1 Tax=Isorropodon fossajaponicum symbiont TaxID=883811 RepID=UPI0019153195|nr:transposase [Isorropodon fossajaponicum symbiont]